MDQDFERWKALVREELKMNRPDVQFEGLSLDAMRNAYAAKVSPGDFSALPAKEILPLRSGPFDDWTPQDGPAEFVNNPRTCVGLSILFLAGTLAMLIAFLLMSVGALGKATAGNYVGTAVFAVLTATGGVTYLFMLRSRWVLYEDRLEYSSPFGRRKTIRRADVKSLRRGANLASYYLSDGKTTIFVGRPIDDWESLRDTLRGWVARQPGN